MGDREPLWRERGGPRDRDVLGIGQISLDRVCRVERLPPPGGKAELGPERVLPGGQIATAVLACSRLGLRVAFAGCVGGDRAAEQALAPLREAGVGLEGLRHVPGAATRSALILVEGKGGERIVLGRRDPALALAAADLDRAEIARSRALLLDAVDPDASRWAARVAREAGIPVVLDADCLRPGVERLVGEVDFPIVSRGFSEQLSEDASPVEGLRALCAGPAVRLAVVTLGDRGAIAASGQSGGVALIESPAHAVEVLDTTGAGDVFHAAFTWGLLEGWGAERVLRAANCAAALSCRGVGAQGALPTRDEVERELGARGR